MELTAYFDANMNTAQYFDLGIGKACLFSRGAPDKAGLNEDSLAIFELKSGEVILAVADGLGGHRGGAQASQLAIKQLKQSLAANETSSYENRTAILNGYEAANTKIQQLGTGAATTLSVAEISTNTVRSYHVGDSTLMVVGRRGRLRLQTKAHSPVGYALEAGLLDENQALHHNERHLISNAVGSADMHIEMGLPKRLQMRDTVLICSDGLSDNFSGQELIEAMCLTRLEMAAEYFINEAMMRMSAPQAGGLSKPDDIGFILFRLKE